MWPTKNEIKLEMHESKTITFGSEIVVSARWFVMIKSLETIE